MAQHEKMVAMGLLAAGVAHEIANPLASMDSALQLIERKPERLGGDVIEKLREQIERITQTVRQLTEFAHPGAHEWEQTTVDEVVARALQMLRFDHRLREADLDIRREVPEGAGQINARPHALEQVLVNLILNALDATADQPERLLVLHTGQRNHKAFIEVSDNGHGIAPEHLAHIFEPFFTTKAPGAGTGLGLAISYTTVQDHGGAITVHSDSERTTFTISIPTIDEVS
jgi:C4-dicarboxylate-specific signal transduction histidine kinase